MILLIPPELHTTILTYLRATDLSALQQTCPTFNNRSLIQKIIHNFANHVYPPELTKGFDTPAIGGAITTTANRQTSSTSSSTTNDGNYHHDAYHTYKSLRNMEMLVVARVLSRPEPPLRERGNGCFYVSKSWCKTALKWLEVQEEQRKQREIQRQQQQEHQHQRQLEEEEEERRRNANVNGVMVKSGSGSGKKHQQHRNNRHNHHQSSTKKQNKRTKKQERKLNRKLSDTLPPWADVNHDITCEHRGLKYCGGSSSRSSRAKRRLMDKQAWKIIKALYPDGVQLSTVEGECIQCMMEVEAEKRNQDMKKQKEMEKRKEPLNCPLVRHIYSRNRGVPKDCLVVSQGQEQQHRNTIGKKGPCFRDGSICPLKPGIYCILPRAWCHKWRKYIKTGEGGRPCSPDTSSCLCDAHRLPLIPPHLESFLYGETSTLLGTGSDLTNSARTSLGRNDETGITPPSLSSQSNVVTMQDYSSPPPRSLSTRSSSVTSTTASLPQGYSRLDQRLGGNTRLRSTPTLSSSSSSSSFIPQYDNQTISTLRASGLSEAEIQLQHLAMVQIEEEQRRDEQQRLLQEQHQQVATLRHEAASQGNQQQHGHHDDIMLSPEDVRANLNAKLDRENKVVVEILTDEEFMALEKWWPEIHCSYALKFAILESDNVNGGGMDIVWTTPPCRDCDASGYSNHDIVVRNRCRTNATPKKKKK